jgi:TPR repeat protein
MAKAKADTSFDRALALNEAGQYKEAFPLMKEAAEAGNVRAMSLLGGMYLLGRGSAENGNEAKRWLKRALEGSFTEAASILGMAYATGKAGIRRNIPLARELLTKAAAAGEEQSKQMLEMMNPGNPRHGWSRRLQHTHLGLGRRLQRARCDPRVS